MRNHLWLAGSVFIGSAIPFVPTGELVSGAAAYASHSELQVVEIFLLTWVCSVLGDTVLLLEARLTARRLGPWLKRRKFGDKVRQAEAGVKRNAFTAIVTGRLLPGGRAPVILALGLARYRLGRFVLYDAVACAAWAAIYSTIGSAGGRLAGHPLIGMGVAILVAVLLGVLINVIRRHRVRRRAAVPA